MAGALCPPPRATPGHPAPPPGAVPSSGPRRASPAVRGFAARVAAQAQARGLGSQGHTERQASAIQSPCPRGDTVQGRSVAPLPPLGSEGGPGLRGGRCGPRSAFPQALLTNRKSVSSVCQLFSSFHATGGSCPAADPSLAEAGVLAARVILMKLICQGKRQLASSRTLSLRVARPRLCHRGTKRGVPDISSV